jgi:hypothetical protein
VLFQFVKTDLMIIFILIFNDALYPHTEDSHQAKEALPMKVILRPSDRPNSPWLMRQWQRLRLAVRALVQNLRMGLQPRHGTETPIPVRINVDPRMTQRHAPRRSP